MDLGSANGGWEWHDTDSKKEAKKVVKKVKKNLPKGKGQSDKKSNKDANHGNTDQGVSKESEDKSES